MVSDPEACSESAVDAQLRQSVGYRVDAPEGYLGLVQGVPLVGRPRRPLVLIVSDGETVRFVSPRRVAAVLPFERRIVLEPRQIAPDSLARAASVRTAASRIPTSC
jgi:hypothetical protein